MQNPKKQLFNAQIRIHKHTHTHMHTNKGVRKVAYMQAKLGRILLKQTVCQSLPKMVQV